MKSKKLEQSNNQPTYIEAAYSAYEPDDPQLRLYFKWYEKQVLKRKIAQK